MTDTELHAYAVILTTLFWIAVAMGFSFVVVNLALNWNKYKRLMWDICSIIVKAFKRPVETRKIVPECTVYTKHGKTIKRVNRKEWAA